MSLFPTEILKKWFCQNRRVFPWRENPTPYRVWISEVMLQQTQSAVVIPYFERWMQQFPSIADLAGASLDEVYKCWEGLGYYSRARNLHFAAKVLVLEGNSELPSDPKKLSAIKGIGPYTQAAIRSFAFHQKAAAVDGNVLRLLSRFFAFTKQIDTQDAKNEIQKVADEILPEEEPWVVSEALIELGATICMKKAKCAVCPLQPECLAYRHHLQNQLPQKKERLKTISLLRDVAVIVCQGKYLVQKNREGEIMAGLYEYPYLEHSDASVKMRFEKALGLPLNYLAPLPEQRHTFTRFRARLFPHIFETTERGGHIWMSREELTQLPFSSGHRRILSHLLTIL